MLEAYLPSDSGAARSTHEVLSLLLLSPCDDHDLCFNAFGPLAMLGQIRS